MNQARSHPAQSAMRWHQDPYDQPDDDDPGDYVPDDDRLVPVGQRPAFTPEPVERFPAYATASRRSYMTLLGALAGLSSRQAGGDVTSQAGTRTAADARIRLMRAHLAEVGQLRDFYGIAR